jgi:hypothetical protein
MDALVVTVDGAGLDPAKERATQQALRAHFAAAGVEPHYAAEAWFAQKCNNKRHARPLLAEKLRRAAGAWGDATLVAARVCGVDVGQVHLGLGPPRRSSDRTKLPVTLASSSVHERSPCCARSHARSAT